MEDIYIVVASQDYDKANHKMFWRQLAKQTGKQVIVVDIPADYAVSIITGHKARIKEAKKGARKISENLTVIRPLLWARPEVLPDCMFHGVAKKIWKCLYKIIPNLDDYRVNFLIYDARWVKILSRTRENTRIAYYLFDEVRFNGNDGSIDKKRAAYDEYACKYSNTVLTMTHILAESRKNYNTNIVVLGNGADVPGTGDVPQRKIKRSVAFIGNFRDWVDKELLEGVISSMPDVVFTFVGPVEENMKLFFTGLLNKYQNTFYYGHCRKEDMGTIYRMFDCVIIPYRDNQFIKATRPIKIVESVLAGTPVVTVPLDGYQETEFIRFASDINGFVHQIRWVMQHPIVATEKNYCQFVDENTWAKKAKMIVDALNDADVSRSTEYAGGGKT